MQDFDQSILSTKPIKFDKSLIGVELNINWNDIGQGIYSAGQAIYQSGSNYYNESRTRAEEVWGEYNEFLSDYGINPNDWIPDWLIDRAEEAREEAEEQAAAAAARTAASSAPRRPQTPSRRGR